MSSSLLARGLALVTLLVVPAGMALAKIVAPAQITGLVYLPDGKGILATSQDGYLREPLPAIAETLLPEVHASEEEILTVLHQLQRFDPAGVGARNLGECLRLQLEVLPDCTPGRELALRVRQTDGWQPFRMIRGTKETTNVTLTFALHGLGTASIDGVQVRSLTAPKPRRLPTVTPEPGPAFPNSAARTLFGPPATR